MRLLLIGDYSLDQLSSMDRYADMLHRELQNRGHVVHLVRPEAFAGRLVSRGVLGKWLGYVDKYLLFPPLLWRESRKWDHAHVCDHSSAMYLPYLPGGRCSITCHDVIAIEAAEGVFAQADVGRRVSRTGRAQQAWIKRHLLAASRVVCVSQSTAARLRNMGARGKITLIYNPTHCAFQPAPIAAVDEVFRRLDLSPNVPYLLHVGGNHWYKNRLGVLQIFTHLRSMPDFRNFTLLMAGPAWTPAMRDFVRSAALGGAVRELVDASDTDLEALYTGAEALLFPSLTEGFGWPVVEAQSCGTLVITSNRDTLQEIAGEGAILIDPAAPEAAARTIARRWPERESIRLQGMKNAGRFAPEALLDAYEHFLGAGPRRS